MRCFFIILLMLVLAGTVWAGGIIDVTAVKMHPVSDKDFRLVGTVQNNTGVRVNVVQVKAMFYDRAGNFYDTHTVFISPIDMEPGQEGTFEFHLTSDDNIDYDKTRLDTQWMW